MGQALERSIQTLQRLPLTQVRCIEIGGPKVIHVLGRCQQLEEFDRAGVPAGGVARQLLQYRRRSLAPTVGQRVCHLGTPAEGSGRQSMPATRPDQIADVGHCPLCTSLDELIIVELGDILFQNRHLFGDHRKKLL